MGEYLLFIRRMVVQDHDRYIEMAKEFYASDAVLHSVPEAYFERTFQEMVRSTDYVEGFFFMNSSDVPAGYSIISKMYSQEAGGMTAWLEEIYVRPEFQGKGFGKAFFDFFQKLHPEMTRIRLEVDNGNDGAIRLYKRMGFVEIPYYQMTKDFPQ